MSSQAEEVFLRGIPISQGIAIGKLFFFTQTEGVVQERKISKEEIDREVKHYRRALQSCKKDVKRLKKQLTEENALEAAAILDTHLQIMSDPLLTTRIEEEIQEQERNAAFVFQEFVSQYLEKFHHMTDPFFRERGRDLEDISGRIKAYLMEVGRPSLSSIPTNSIVFTSEIAASDVAEAKMNRVTAVITDKGGPTSHPAIIAKAKGIPYVANVQARLLEAANNEVLIVDGRNGDIILNPSKETLKKYRSLQKQFTQHFRALEKAGALEAETFDGYKMLLSANIEIINEVDLVHQYGANGVGLFRSEYIFLSKQNFPNEEEQYRIYRNIVEKMNGLPLVIRTFDVGGDKLTVEQRLASRGNPYLGCRAIRFLLKEKDIFKTQMRAILRASAFGNVKIMFPMVSGVGELIEAKSILKEVQEELKGEEKPYAKKIRVGCMIEVPSAAIIADLLAQECDFLSIGTNDLVQYTLAVDRSDQATNMLYTPMHPSVIRLIRLVVSSANQYMVPVTVCGEIAADPRFTPLLMGLGVHELSVASRSLPAVKQMIRRTGIVPATELAERVLSLSTPGEIQELLNEEYQKSAPEELSYIPLSLGDVMSEK